jgi:CRP/FNR family transcriptional regulator, cyclic AMP receptor protein
VAVISVLRPGNGGGPAAEWPNNSLLGRLRPRTREALLSLGTPINYAARQPAIRQGEDSRYVLLLLSGCAKVVVHTEIGRDVLVGMRGAGEMVGEMALLADDDRSANVITATSVSARLLKGVELLELMERSTELSVVIARMITERLRFADRRRVEFIACPAPERVGRVLVELVDQYGTHFSNGWRLRIPLNQAEIASLAGVALSTVEKALQAMQRKAMLRRRYRHIVVTDLARLRSFSGLPERHPY